VFEGELSKVQLTKMQKELLPYINNELDSVILFKSRQEKWLDKELWGKQDDTTSFII
jgi:CRISPR-associated protein Cas2